MKDMGLRLDNVVPGEDIPVSGLHYHDLWEGSFYVVDGQLHVETPDEVFVVTAGQCFITEPQSPHRAFNDVDSRNNVVVVAMGAPAAHDGHPYGEKSSTIE